MKSTWFRVMTLSYKFQIPIERVIKGDKNTQIIFLPSSIFVIHRIAAVILKEFIEREKKQAEKKFTVVKWLSRKK